MTSTPQLEEARRASAASTSRRGPCAGQRSHQAPCAPAPPCPWRLWPIATPRAPPKSRPGRKTISLRRETTHMTNKEHMQKLHWKTEKPAIRAGRQAASKWMNGRRLLVEGLASHNCEVGAQAAAFRISRTKYGCKPRPAILGAPLLSPQHEREDMAAPSKRRPGREAWLLGQA
jgi:hypothetical protein